MKLDTSLKMLALVLAIVSSMPAGRAQRPTTIDVELKPGTTSRLYNSAGFDHLLNALQSSSDAPTVSYKCSGGSKLTAQFTQGEPGSAKVTRGSSTWDLPQVRSASGAKYSKGKVTLWTKGPEATFIRKGKTYKCTQQN